MNYYISDTHFNDQRIFNLCSRPFNNVSEASEKMVARWNARVKDEDYVYMLGDIGWIFDDKEIAILKKLKGKKILIKGNHDLPFMKIIEDSGVFVDIHSIAKIKDEGREVWLCHYPIMDWPNNTKDGSYHLFGHIHNKELKELKAYFKDKRAFNVGVDVNDFKPLTLDELIKKGSN